MQFYNHHYKDLLSKYNLEYFFSLKNPPLSKKSFSDVINLNLDNHDIFIKRYYSYGKKLIYYFNPKSYAEYKNLNYFSNHGFNTPEIIAYLKKKNTSCIITKKLENSYNLYEYFIANSIRDKKHAIKHPDFIYLIKYVETLKKLHDANFAHRDYKLRNVLLSQDKELYLIDCPNGINFNAFPMNIFSKCFAQKFILRDLILAYKSLKNFLNNKQILYLYKYHYLKTKKLTMPNKKIALRIIKHYL